MKVMSGNYALQWRKELVVRDSVRSFLETCSCLSLVRPSPLLLGAEVRTNSRVNLMELGFGRVRYPSISSISLFLTHNIYDMCDTDT